MSARSYAVIGTGAVGGFYGARLAHAGLDVHFLLHGDYEHVRRHGLRVDSVDGDFTLSHAQAYAQPDDMPPCDVVVVALKTTQNHLLPQLLPKPAGDRGVVLMLQNGLGVEDDAAQIVGHDRVMGGLCFLCSNKVGPGHIHHLDYGFVTFAEHAAEGRAVGITPRMEAVAGDFRVAEIETRCVEDLVLARWQKLIWNIPFNGLSVVLDATSAELMADPQTRGLAEALMREVADGARSCGREIDGAFIRHMLDLTEKMKPYRTSMKIDCELKRPLEVEAIFGNALRAAVRAGVQMPRVNTLYKQLKFIDGRNLAAMRSESA
ncbi:MAG: putative 2-dehydropantoate 2-reductase [Planctomycetes bacterium]|nr:putative 2-dehydropantoate 2-reductase [Planctomycetota bacterium]